MLIRCRASGELDQTATTRIADNPLSSVTVTDSVSVLSVAACQLHTKPLDFATLIVFLRGSDLQTSSALINAR